jgi:fatty-acid desaturase
MEYIEFCIDETESYETEQQRKYSVINEILLFIIAFVQIAPMLYSALLGDYNDLVLWPVIFMIALVVISIFFIVRKS